MICGRIHSEESFGTLDGPGVRYVIFLQGCCNNCIYCHNPDTWNAAAGKAVSVQEVVDRVLSCRNFIASGGVTLSGGEPMCQKEFTLALLNAFRREKLHTALDTSAPLELEDMQSLLDAADLILLDIKGASAQMTERVSGNAQLFERALSALQYCQKSNKAVWIRHVLIPGYTLDSGEVRCLAELLNEFACIKRVELLGFHTMGFHKWEKLDRFNVLQTTPAVSSETLKKYEEIFSAHCHRTLIQH